MSDDIFSSILDNKFGKGKPAESGLVSLIPTEEPKSITNPQPTPAPQPQEDLFAAVLDKKFGKRREPADIERLRANALDAMDKNPEEYAKARALAQKTGVPVDVAYRNLKEVEKQAFFASDDFQRLAEQFPQTAKFLQEREAATLAKDDLDSLKVLETIFSNPLGDIAKSLGKGALGLVTGTQGIAMLAGDAMSNYITGPLARMRVIPQDVGALIARRFSTEQRGWSQYADRVGADKSQMGAVMQSVHSGIESLGQNLVTIGLSVAARNPAPMLGMMGMATSGQSYAKAREKDVPFGVATGYALSDGVIEILTERIPAINLITDLGLNRSFIKSFIRQQPADQLGEQIATAMQDLNEWAVLNPTKPFSSYLEERPNAALQTAIATLVAGGGQIAVAKALDRAVNGDEYARQEAFFKALGDASAQSKLRERAPDLFERAVKLLSDGGPVEYVRIPVEQFTTYFQTQQMNPATVASELGARNYSEAAAIGGDVLVPVEKYASMIAASEHHAPLMQDLRLREGDMTARERKEFEANNPDIVSQLQSMMETAAKQGEDVNAQIAPIAEKIVAEVEKQLVAAGMETSTARASASIMRGLAVMAARAFPNRTPAEVAAALWSQYGLTIERDSMTAMPADAMTQGSFLAGEIAPPEWDGSGAGTNEAAFASSYGDAVSEAGVSRWGAATAAGEDRGLATAGAGGRQVGLRQEKNNAPRGYIQFGSDRKFKIKLLEGADLSTFLHEAGHFYLEVLGDLAEADGASEQIKADYVATLKWLGVTKRGEITREHHEKFARGNEAYLMEGKAPNAELHGIFAKFAAWLKLLYREIRNLNVQLNEEVRGVFDRIYATDEEIEAAREEGKLNAMFATAKDAGMSEEEFAAYRKAAERASIAAQEKLRTKAMQQMMRERKAAWLMERNAVQTEVEEEVASIPVYRAFATLTDGLDGVQIKLDRKALADKFGEEMLKQLPRTTQRVYAKEGGWEPELAAESLGFTSATALVEALLQMQPRAEYIKNRTDQIMRERHGDMMLDGTLADEAEESIHNEFRANVLREELRAINRMRAQVRPFIEGKKDDSKAALKREKKERAYERRWMEAERNLMIAIERGKADAEIEALEQEVQTLKLAAQQEAREARAAQDTPSIESFRAAARGMIGLKQLADVSPNEYLIAERKAAKKAFELASKKKWTEAAMEKQRELLNHFMYLEAVRAKEDGDSILKYLSKFDSKAVRAKIGKAGHTYLDQIDSLLERYELKRVPLEQLRKRESLLSWAQEQESQGNIVNIDERLLDEARRVNYKRAQVDELRALRDTVRNIEHLATFKNKLLVKQKMVEFERVRESLLGALESNFKMTGELSRLNDKADGVVAKGKRLWRKFDAAHLKIEQIVEWMDGGATNGPWARYFFDLADDAQVREYDMHRSVTKRIIDLSESMPRKWRDSLMERTGVTMPGVSGELTKYDVISIAMNTGNLSNYNKLLEGREWTVPQVDAALATMTKADWDFVQGVWDTLDSLWPEIAALEKRVSGIGPPRVEPKEISTPHGVYRGGYFPLVYDQRMSEAGRKQADSTDVANFVARGYGMATTSKGHTKERMENFAAPLKLDYETVLTSHLAKVVKDISHREAVIGINKILRDKEIKASLIERIGEERYTLMNNWLQVLIADRADTMHQDVDWYNKIFRGLRTNTAIVTMGWKISTALSQFAGFGPSADIVKGKYLSGAMVKFTRNPKALNDFVAEKSGEMRHRSNTLERDVKDSLLKLRGDRSLLADVQRSAFYLTAMADKVVAVPTWYGAYKQSLAEGMSEEDAIRAGDRAVRLSQGAGGAKDLAAVQRNNEFMRLLTMYYTPFSVLYNRLRDLGRDTRSVRDVPRAVARSLALVILPAVLGDLLAGRGPDDDEDATWWALRKILLYPIASIPVLRDLAAWKIEPMMAEAGGGQLNYNPSYQFSPVVGSIRKIMDAPGKVYDAAAGERPWADAGWAAFEASGYVFGLPTAQVSITGKYLTDLFGGEENPENLGELLHGLAHRRPQQ